jgi:ABC-type multidrug transport system fused ATPase/permease subunit
VLIVLLFVVAYLSAMYPKVVGDILDSLETGQAEGHGLAGLVEICLMTAVVVVLQKVTLAMLEERVFLSLKLSFFEWLIRADLAFFDRNKLGEVNSRLGTDINQAKAAVSSSLTHFLRNLLTFLCILVALILMSPLLSTLILAVYLTLALTTVTYTRIIKALVKDYQQATAEATATSIEAFHNIHLIKSRCT